MGKSREAGARGPGGEGGRHGTLFFFGAGPGPSARSFLIFSFLFGYFIFGSVYALSVWPGRTPYLRNRGSSPRFMIMGHRLGVVWGRGCWGVWGGCVLLVDCEV